MKILFAIRHDNKSRTCCVLLPKFIRNYRNSLQNITKQLITSSATI